MLDLEQEKNSRSIKVTNYHDNSDSLSCFLLADHCTVIHFGGLFMSMCQKIKFSQHLTLNQKVHFNGKETQIRKL